MEVTRQAGDSVGNVMQRWRQIRKGHPELLAGLRVWQSPTAFVHGVVWSWQQAEEASRFESLVRVVDSLRTHWTPDAQERNFLAQTVQQCVAPGQTPLTQPTDTGFAQLGKAAANDEHERQRTRPQTTFPGFGSCVE